MLAREDRLVQCPPGCEPTDPDLTTAWIQASKEQRSNATHAGFFRNAKPEDFKDGEFAGWVDEAGIIVMGDLILMVGQRARIEANDAERNKINASVEALLREQDESNAIKPQPGHSKRQGKKVLPMA